MCFEELYRKEYVTYHSFERHFSKIIKYNSECERNSIDDKFILKEEGNRFERNILIFEISRAEHKKFTKNCDYPEGKIILLKSDAYQLYDVSTSEESDYSEAKEPCSQNKILSTKEKTNPDKFCACIP